MQQLYAVVPRRLMMLLMVGLAAAMLPQCGKEKPQSYVDLKDYVVNLADPGGNRFLKVKMKMIVESDQVANEFSANGAKISDEIITFLSTKKVEELISPLGKKVLKRQLMDLLNEKVLKAGDVQDIFFTDFVIQ